MNERIDWMEKKMTSALKIKPMDVKKFLDNEEAHTVRGAGVD